jgi:hypothetical protein
MNLLSHLNTDAVVAHLQRDRQSCVETVGFALISAGFAIQNFIFAISTLHKVVF